MKRVNHPRDFQIWQLQAQCLHGLAFHKLVPREWKPGHPTRNFEPLIIVHESHKLQFRYEIDAALGHLARVLWLIRDLDSLKERENKYYRKIIKKLRNTSNSMHYASIRHELAICSTLARKGVNIVSFESPDFTLDEGVGIECTSAHLDIKKNIERGEQAQRLVSKLGAIVKEKSTKNYATRSCALVIDITNLMYAARAGPDQSFTQQQLEDPSKEWSNFGSTILTWVGFDTLIDRISRVYLRTDTSPSDLLRSKLDVLYPKHDSQRRAFKSGLFAEG